MTDKTKIRILLSALAAAFVVAFLLALKVLGTDSHWLYPLATLAIVGFFGCTMILRSLSQSLQKRGSTNLADDIPIISSINEDLPEDLVATSSDGPTESKSPDSTVSSPEPTATTEASNQDKADIVAAIPSDGILDSIIDLVIILDEDCRIVKLNPVAEKVLADSDGSLQGLDFFDVVQLNERSNISSESVILHKIFDEDKVALEVNLRCLSGKEIPVYLAGSVLRQAGSTGARYIFSARDMTDVLEAQSAKKEAQRKLAQSARLASLSTLGAGIAHELNNPLVGVRGYAELILTNPKSPPRTQELARKIMSAADRIQLVVKHLRSFSANTDEKHWVNFNINATIESSLVLLREQLVHHEITVNTDLENCYLAMNGNSTAIESVVQNILANARDAFKESLSSEKKVINITSIVNEQNEISIAISDNADGIDEDILKNIFDPFFTTKEVGKGQGLGLSTSHGIVSDHNGTIEVTSKPGEGTTFTLKFPLASYDYEGLRSGDPLDQPENSIPPNLKIAVVDDEQVVLDIVESYLADVANVRVFNNPVEAVVAFSEEDFDIVLTDMKMPEMSGLKLIRELKLTNPTATAIVITGHAQTDLEIVEAQQNGAAEVIAKPFPTKDEFAKLVFDCYERTSGSITTAVIPKVAKPIEAAERLKRILIIDDQEPICEIMEIFLGDDYLVTTTSDSLEGIQLIEAHDFDLIFTDLQMPGVSGLDVVSKAKSCLPGAGIIVMTGSNENDAPSQQALKLGADAILTKPFEGKTAVKELAAKFGSNMTLKASA